jgi:hypothetical protein
VVDEFAGFEEEILSADEFVDSEGGILVES